MSAQTLPFYPAPVFFQDHKNFASPGALPHEGFTSRSVLNSVSGSFKPMPTNGRADWGAMMRFNIGVEIVDALAMRALALQRHLAQGYSESDFIAAETVLWPDQPEAYWLTVIADSLGSGRGFRFVRTHQQ